MWPACRTLAGDAWCWTRVVALLSLVGISSCTDGGDGNGARGATVRTDSAGVEIVTNLRPLWSDAGAWHIAAAPDLQIGQTDGAAEEILHGVTAIRHLDEAILVAQATEVRLYDEDGSFVRQMGGAGRGPGEFFRVADIMPCGDRVYASELSPAQLVVFEPSGQSRTVPLPKPETQGLLNPLSPLLGCTPLGVIGGMSGPPPEGGNSPEVQRQTGLIVHLHLDGTGVDTLLSFPGVETYAGLTVPFGRRTLVAALDTLLYLADNGTPEFRVLGLDGMTRQVVRLGISARDVTAADIERIRAQYLTGLPPGLVAEIEPRLDAVSVRPTMPYLSQLKVATDGTVWLQYYQAFRDEVVTRWTAVDSTGVWLGDVVLPDGFSPHQFHANYVIGLWRDEFDVEFVQRYPIQK